MVETRHRPLGVVEAQFASAWDMLREAMGHFPAGQWCEGEIPHLVPARLAYHAIETADYYCRGDLAAFQWGGRFAVGQEAETERLPDQQALLEYLEEVRGRTSRWLESLGDAGLLAPDAAFHTEGMSHLDRALYVLRHLHHHLGELCAELRRRGLPRPRWR